jgi:hypothetical protein
MPGRARSGGRPRRVAIIPVIAAALLLAGCGSSHPPGPSSTASPTATPVPPTPSPSVSSLKPVLSGLLDRNGTPPAAYVPSLGGFVVNVHWSDLQPSRGGTLAPDNAIDQAIVTVRALNAQYHVDLGLKIRVFAGVWAPTWAKGLGGHPITLINPQNGAEGTIGPFWTESFGAAYDQLETLLAAKYDEVAEIREVTISRCSTFYDEPFIRDTGYSPNVTALLAAGYSVAADETCQREEIQASAVWHHTHSDLAFNPYEAIFPGGTTSTDELFTESMMAYCRQVLASACVLENNSLRFPVQAGYMAMYANMQALGHPISFQTATAARVGNLSGTLNYAITLGASSVELPGGYETLGTPSSFASTTRALAAASTA